MSKIEEFIAVTKDLLKKKDVEIDSLKKAVEEKGKPQALFSFPEVKMHVPDSVKVANLPDVQKVEITNQKETIFVSVKNTPDVQKVQVINHPKNETKENKWIASVVITAVKSLMGGFSKLWSEGLTVKLDDEERLKPLPVIVVDHRGRPVNMQSQGGNIMIPMPGGSGRSGGTPPPSAIVSGRKTVTTPGTPVKLLATATACKKVMATAPSSNGGTVYIGGITTSAVAGSEQGLMLLPTGSALIEIDDVSKLYIDATSAGEGVTFAYFN